MPAYAGAPIQGQQAMAVAVAYPEPEKGGRGNKGLGDLKVSSERLSCARTVLRWAPELVDDVLGGGSLDQAYQRALAVKQQADAEERALAG